MGYVTHSELACFRRCMREHMYRYVERVEPLVPAEALVRGKRSHTSLALWWQGDDMASDGPPAERAMLFGYAARYERPHLRGVHVNVPFAVDLGSVTLVGELDAMGTSADVELVIVEHKTTSSNISPGGAYWREVTLTAPQPSAYLRAFPKATVLWDALHKPQLRKLRQGKPNEETDAEFESRILSDMAERPEHYFQRATIVRLEAEHEAFEEDVRATAALIADTTEAPRNPGACWTFGRACDFFGVCWEGRSLDGPGFVRNELNHTESIAKKVGA